MFYRDCMSVQFFVKRRRDGAKNGLPDGRRRRGRWDGKIFKATPDLFTSAGGGRKLQKIPSERLTGRLGKEFFAGGFADARQLTQPSALPARIGKGQIHEFQKPIARVLKSSRVALLTGPLRAFILTAHIPQLLGERHRVPTTSR